MTAGIATTGILLTSACTSAEQAPKPLETPNASDAMILDEWTDGVGGYLPEPQIVLDETAKINEALAAAEQVASVTGYQQARDIVEFAKSRAIPSVVTSLGPLSVRGSALKPEEFFVISLSQKDLGLNPVSDALLNFSANGFYNEEISTLALYEEADFSEKWLGILVLHELSHAKNNSVNATHSPVEEATVRRFHHQLASKLFGRPYVEYVAKTTEALRPDFDQFLNGQKPLIIPEINIDKISTGSPQEQRFADSTVLFNSIFNLLDGKVGSTDLTKHQQVYDAVTDQAVIK